MSGKRFKPQYTILSHIEQILLRPHIYLNSIQSTPRKERLFKDDRFAFNMISTPLAVENIFLEILMNSSDNIIRSKEANVHTGPIIINMTNKRIMVQNGGITIPIENTKADLSKIQGHPKELLNPTMIFGYLLTSSNYDDTETRFTSGRHGLGCKLTSIFSSEFNVIIDDVDNQKHFEQTWTNNLSNTEGPKVLPIKKGSDNMVRVTYTLDFDRFASISEYSDEVIFLYMRHAADVAFTTNNPVIFRSHLGEKIFNATTISKYTLLFPGIKNSATHTQDNVQLTLVDSPNAACSISFVNSVQTRNGGVHIDSVYDVIKCPILEQINGGKTMKMVSGKKTTKFSLTLRDLKPHVGIIMSCKLINPQFSEQTKEKLLGPKVRLSLPSTVFSKIKKWKLMGVLAETLKDKQRKSLGKGDSRGKKKNVKVLKADDANRAGTNKSHDCSLWLTEGLSAAGYIDVYLSTGSKSWRNTNGVYPLKGKLINLRNATPLQLAENNEFNGIKTILGLREDMDYSDERNFRMLRYGRVMLAVDADADGKHIASLILNLFENKWKSLLERQYVLLLRTPIIRVWSGSRPIKFYNQVDYVRWKDRQVITMKMIPPPPSRIIRRRPIGGRSNTGSRSRKKIKYYKGLGSSNARDIKEDYRSPRQTIFICDEKATSTIELVFDKANTDLRKEWLSNPPSDPPEIEIDDSGTDKCTISDYLNYETINFSLVDNGRSIAKVTDGFKTSQRKILWMCKLHWSGASGERAKELKVAQLATKVAEKLGYHYGENNLAGAIVHLAQSFTGTNNLPLISDDGNYGSRYANGTWASPRYIFTRPTWAFNLIFKDEDIPLFDYVIDDTDEEKKCEPVTLLPIIPLHLVNGSKGIGTAYSSTIPNHNPLDVCRWVLAKLEGKTLPVLKPWYRGFEGSIDVIRRKSRIKNVNSVMDDSAMNTNSASVVTNSASVVSKSVVTNSASVVSKSVVMKTRRNKPVVKNKSVVKNKPVVKRDNNIETMSDNDDVKRDEIDDDDGISEMLASENKGKFSMISMGVFNVDDNKNIIVTEVPVTQFYSQYKKHLENLRDDNKISDFNNTCSVNSCKFIISGFKDKPTHESLKLIKSVGLGNMVLLNENDFPQRYSGAQEIMEVFYAFRIGYYIKRREYMISKIEDDIRSVSLKLKLILLVVEKRYDPLHKRIGLIEEELKEYEIPIGVFKKVSLSNCTFEEVKTLKSKIEGLIVRKDGIIKTTHMEMWVKDINEFTTAYKMRI